MGTVLSNWRLPVDPAVDVLTRRRWFDYVELVLELDKPTYHIWTEVPSRAPRNLYPGKAYRLLIEALTGRHRGPFAGARFEDESDDPRFWALYGARLVGWEWSERPLRYSLPGDLGAIRQALDTLTDADLRANIIRAYNNPPPEVDAYPTPPVSLEGCLQSFDEKLTGRFSPALRRFYAAAQDEEEIVVHWIVKRHYVNERFN